jgi:hypothetical protein
MNKPSMTEISTWFQATEGEGTHRHLDLGTIDGIIYVGAPRYSTQVRAENIVMLDAP